VENSRETLAALRASATRYLQSEFSWHLFSGDDYAVKKKRILWFAAIVCSGLAGVFLNVREIVGVVCSVLLFN
jgi:hypothetical protein